MITNTKLDPIETASVDELQALQTQRLKWTLKHAYENVPMYRRKFDAAGVHPDDFRELSDLRKFPCTTKQDLRDNYPFDTFAVPMEQVVRIHASSGTTGKPTVVGYTQNDIDNWANIVARSLRAAGGTPKDKIHVAYGYGLFTGGLGAHYGAERLGATVIPMSGGQTEKQAQLIRDFQPDMIMVTPSYCLNLIEELERQLGGDASGCSLRVGVFGAEPWTQAMRKDQCHQGWCKTLDGDRPCFQPDQKIHRVLPVARQQFHSPSPPKLNILRYDGCKHHGHFPVPSAHRQHVNCQHGGVISPVCHARKLRITASKHYSF